MSYRFPSVPVSNFYQPARYLAGAIAGVNFAKTIKFDPQPLRQVSRTKMNPSYTRTRTQRKRKVNSYKNNKVATVASVKRMIQGNMETKQKNFTIAANSIVSNSILCHNLTAQISQGSTDGSRIGDEVHLSSFIGNFRYVTDAASAYYTCRVLIGYSGEEFNPSTTAFTTGLTSSQLFVATPSGGAQGVVNTKAFTVLYDNLMQVNSTISGIQEGQTIRFNQSLAGKFKYQEAGAIYGKTKNLYIVVCPEANASTAPPTAGFIVLNGVLKYKDA